MIIEAAIGVGIVVTFGLRQLVVRKQFMDHHKERIREDDEEIARQWRHTNPRDRILMIERTFKPPIPFAPTIKIRREFRR